jgi:hypothetical protein
MKDWIMFGLVIILSFLCIASVSIGRDQGWASCAAQHKKPTKPWWDNYVEPTNKKGTK